MAEIDRFRDLTSQIQQELLRGSDYFHHTKLAWRLAPRFVASPFVSKLSIRKGVEIQLS
jgi:hypothetical protein